MKKIIISTIAVSALLFTVTSCKTDFDTDVKDIQVTKGDANFSKYVALGNSLTSGFRDNALYIDGQNESYPLMLAGQMKLAGGGEFKQPMMPNNSGGFTNLANPVTGDFLGKMGLVVGCNNALGPKPSAPGAPLDNILSGGPYQNLGVPGAKSFHLGLANYGTLNPYYSRFSTGVSPVAAAVAQSPTFFSLWIGNNDVLSYATSGGTGVDQTGNANPLLYGSNDITDPTVYKSVINQYVTALTANGAKGVLANIPNVTSIPFFTTVPSKPVANLSDAQAAQLNAAYAPYNAGLAQVKSLGLITDVEYQSRLIKFAAGSTMNGAVILDKDLKDLTGINPALKSYRQTTSNDFIILTAANLLKPYDATCNPQGISAGTAVPLEDKYVLTEKETAKVITATAAYNTALKDIATSKGLAFVDANAKLIELSGKSGISWDGVKYSATFVSGGAFSLDGVHLTGRGYAVIANEFIKAINSKYKSTLPQVDPNKYSGVKFP
ncbi:G-D-S-L family lipolytic protein [Chryseobacterium sp. BIGb0232]|uniref:G-D-S-L family lipolytic protein n=1 Tax=Chryseobacterium sp. BIGb0232 TaxID=2940598 RepID=UPI000F481713|nr:G-D-S-L family lipolytic protein [Chryseobacterium sp. BIGb0232]MCS4304424.1 lysophospholipase L1-like esterase [Chryseobacterium sp. BIGb0232]ROS14439.1 GDSL-like lipase/acylhydrolase family protein [Chryseobacterium nakagawai]